MIVLGIETSTARSSVALLVDGTVVAHEEHEDARGHGAFVAPAIRRCLDVIRDGPGPVAVDAVGVGTGPGLYTGLRVGMATAAAFAAASDVPVVGIGGLDALAFASGVVDATVVTTLDARRGQVFWAVHRPASEAASEAGPEAGPEAGHGSGAAALTCVDGPQVGSRDEFDAALAVLGAGVLAAAGSEGPVQVLGEVGGTTVERPDAVATARLAQLALERAAAGHTRITPPSPVYLRDADVRIGWDERGGRRGGAA